MRSLNAVLAAAGLCAVTACDRIPAGHEIVRAGNQTYLLDKASGDVKLIDGTALVQVRAKESVPVDNSLKQAKNWPPQVVPQIGNITLVVRTKYRDGAMLYSVEASPFQGSLEKEFGLGSGVQSTDYLRQPTIIVDFYDSDGFPVGEPIELKVREATRMVNTKGDAYALTWTGSQALSAEAYGSTTSQSLRWAGFSK